MQEEDIVITLVKNNLALYKYPITILLIMEYMTARLMHDMSKCKEKDPQGEDMAMVTCQIKTCDPPLWEGLKT